MIRILKLLVLIPIVVVVLAFAIANRGPVSISFDPFSPPGTSNLIFPEAPMFVVLLLTLMLGVLIGGIATWFTQGVNRRRARMARDEAERWQEEAMRLRDQAPAVGMPNRVMLR